ncbi:MAG: class I tRNA ligase family protein, partial [Planctomycetota bacterium]|nr:class I tRNA ligase family protein [Planctomycetota bacterium]
RVYKSYDFRKAHEAIHNFCNETLSAVYFAATKDRMYCDPADGPRRRRTQTAMLRIADALLRLVAPILPYTADEGWRHLYGQAAPSIHLALFPEEVGVEADQGWPLVIVLRDQILKAVEETRQKSGIDNTLDMGVRLTYPADVPAAAFVARFSPVDLADLCNISRVEVVESKSGEKSIRIETLDLRAEPRCDRSWRRDGTVKPRADGGMLSDRDAQAIGVA